MTEPVTPLPPGVVDVNGKHYMVDAKEALVPIELVKPSDRAQDDMVRDLFAKADAVSKAIVAFKTHAFADIDALHDLVLERYGAKLGGAKGNVSLFTFDGLMKIQVQVADLVSYGDELQAAKALIDECLQEWADDSRAEIRAIVMNAFRVDKEGKINRGALLQLRTLNIEDERWKRAMDAIKDAERVLGSKRYIRVFQRANPKAEWRMVSLDIATA
jgi:hypothetical protein